MWPDSGKIQEEDAKYYKKHQLSKHENPEPLYDAQTAEQALKLLEPIDYGTEFQIGDINFKLSPAGHILGAACVVAEHAGHRVGFSGDLGRYEDIMMRPPQPIEPVDTLLLESTYGDRLHDTRDPYEVLEEVVNTTMGRGGVLLIPSFAVGRAQVLQHMLVTLMEEGRIPRVPVFLDSPMAINVSDIYHQYHQFHKLSAADCSRAMQFVEYTHSVKESQTIAEQTGPHIIIAGSGMATGGRILHHFKHWLNDHRTTVLFSGHQAGGTRGAKMLRGVNAIKVHGQWLPLKAEVRELGGLSGHADYQELLRWVNESKLPKHCNIQLIHGEAETLETFRDYLSQETNFAIDIPDYMSILRVGSD